MTRQIPQKRTSRDSPPNTPSVCGQQQTIGVATRATATVARPKVCTFAPAPLTTLEHELIYSYPFVYWAPSTAKGKGKEKRNRARERESESESETRKAGDNRLEHRSACVLSILILPLLPPPLPFGSAGARLSGVSLEYTMTLKVTVWIKGLDHGYGSVP